MRIVKAFLKYLGVVYFIFLSILFFVPKTNLYYLGENELSQYQSKIIGEEITDTGFGLNIENLEIYFNDVFVSNIRGIYLTSYLLFTKIEINTIQVDQMLKKLSLVDMDRVTLTHNVFNPLQIDVTIVADAGSVTGVVDILNRNIRLKYLPNLDSKEHMGVLSQFRLVDKEYIYEKNF